MSQEIDDLLKKCVELREGGRLEEAILSARRATNIDPKSANAWWQLGLSVAKKDGDALALDPFKKTVELAEGFAYGWYRLGNAYKKLEMINEAVEAWESACENDEDSELARYKLIDAYNERGQESEKEKLFDQLVQLENRDKLRAYDYHLLAMAHHNKGNYLNAIPYYKKYFAQRSDKYGCTNLSLAYSSTQVGQDLDASDWCRLALTLDEDYERARKHYEKLQPKLNATKEGALRFLKNNELISKDKWYTNYVNPFELLQLTEADDADELDTKEIQKAKKLLLQEIELEDGVIDWMPGLKIDKSRAIKLADELTDQKTRLCHHLVFKHKPLLNFLSRGDVAHFLFDKDHFPEEVITTFVENDEFAKWIGDVFAKQYDELFAAALSSKRIEIIKPLLDGRRFVPIEDEDRCFATGVRYSADFLDDLKAAQARFEKTKPSIQDIRFVLGKKNLDKILEILPHAFQDIQTEAAQTIRNIAIDIYNKHGDADLSKEVLGIATSFANKSPSVKVRMEKDLSKINELIQEEKKDESHLSFGDVPFKITREGVKYGDKFLKNSETETLRWGIAITNTSGIKVYEFKMAFGGKGSFAINVSWKASTDIKKQDDLFQQCVSAIFSYILPSVIERIQSELRGGRAVYIGGVPATKGGVMLKAKGWFSEKEEFCPWASLSSEIKNGSAEITSSMNSKAGASLSLADIDNAWILHILINQGMMK
jgi:tetratricopeptide (TPR) repeat protein